MDSATPLQAQLDVLDARYGAVLALTPTAQALRDDAAECARLADEFRRIGYVQVPHITEQSALSQLCDALWPILSPLTFTVSVAHEPEGLTLTSGGRLRRVDPRSLDPGGQGAVLSEVLSAIGLTEFGWLFAQAIAPIVTRVVGSLEYERIFVNLYDEGDYLTAHDDAHMGDRYDVNLSVTFDGVCGLRVLSGGTLQTHYDGDGAIGILGPGIWHEVPPLLRRPGSLPPRRMTITLRYWPR